MVMALIGCKKAASLLPNTLFFLIGENGEYLLSWNDHLMALRDLEIKGGWEVEGRIWNTTILSNIGEQD